MLILQFFFVFIIKICMQKKSIKKFGFVCVFSYEKNKCKKICFLRSVFVCLQIY